MFGHICAMILALGVLYSGIVSLNQYSVESSKAKKKIKKREKPSLVSSFFKSAGITALVADSGKLVMYSTSSFCFSGLINFETAFVCILGASVTSGASSFLALINERNLIYIILGLGGIMRFILRKSRHENLKLVAMFIFSIGLLLFGIILIKDNFAFIGNNDYVKHIITRFHYPLLILLIGTAISFIMQSTAGFTFMIIGLWGSTLISYEQSVLMLYGACLSSCIKARLYSLPFKGSARRLMLANSNITLATTTIVIGLYFLEKVTSIPLLNSLLRSIHKNVIFEVGGAMLITNLFIVFLCLIFLKHLVRLYTKIYPDDIDEALAKTYYINGIESLPESQWYELMNRELDRIIANFYVLVDLESSQKLPDAKSICNSNNLILNRIKDIHNYMYGGGNSSSLQEYRLYEKLLFSNNLNNRLARYCEIINRCDKGVENVFTHAVSIHVLLVLKCLSDFICNKTNIEEVDIVTESLNFNLRKAKVLEIIKDIKAEYDTKFELAYIYCDILVYLSGIINLYKYDFNTTIPGTNINEN